MWNAFYGRCQLFLETFVFAAVYFWPTSFLICQTNGEQMIKRVRLLMVDFSCFCLSPISAFIHKPHFSLAVDDKPGARPITGTLLLATVTTRLSHICVRELRGAKGYCSKSGQKENGSPRCPFQALQWRAVARVSARPPLLCCVQTGAISAPI